MKRSIVFATPLFLPLIESAKRAEAAKFDRIWTTENPSRDALVRGLTFALHTKSIGIGTGIAYAFTRSPLAMAAAASDIHTASGGRFSLGLGVGTQGMRSRWYGLPDFDHPASRLEEYVEVLREAWQSEKVFEHQGQFYQGNYPSLDGARNPVPVWGSGINAAMLKLSARACDGVATHPLCANIKYLDKTVLPAINEGRAAHTRSLELAIWRITSIDADGDIARERARRNLAFYFSTPSYATAAADTGWGEVSEKVQALYKERGADWAAISDLIPEEMVQEFAFAGTPNEVMEQWSAAEKDYVERGVTEIVFQTVGSGEIGEETIQNIDLIVNTFSRS